MSQERAVDRLVGQPVAWKTLRRFLDRGQNNRTLLFHGPRSSGKRTAARLLAADLLADQRPVRNTHPDYVELSGRDVEDIEKVRTWKAAADKAPFEATRTVMLLCSVERASAAANNSLLKLLEEPPPHVTIVLTCQDVGAVLDTIQSRSLKARFAELTPEQKTEIVRRRGVSTDVAERVAFSATLFDATNNEAFREAATAVQTARRIYQTVRQGEPKLVAELAETADTLELVRYVQAVSDRPPELAAAQTASAMFRAGVKRFQANLYLFREIQRCNRRS